MPPNLTGLLPDEGFRWNSGRGKFFLSSPHCRLIVRALRQFCPIRIIGKEFVSAAFTELLTKATENIAQCASMAPEDFWAAVGGEVRWVANDAKIKSKVHIDGTVLYSLSLLLISARYFRTSDAEDLYELEMISYDDFKDMLGDTELTRAVDEYKNKVQQAYPAGSETREQYVPKYTQQSHNEGSAEATAAAFARMCETRMLLPPDEDANTTEEGTEEVDEQDYEEYYDGQDDDEDNDEDNDEMDWEAEPENEDSQAGGSTGGQLADLVVRTKHQS
jgi:hypothetical protein